MTTPAIAPQNNATLTTRAGEPYSGVLQQGSSSGGGAGVAPSPGGVPVLLGPPTPTVTGSGVSIVLDFSTAMARGAGSIYITDGAVQTVIDRVTGQPTMRIVGATDTKAVPASSVSIDGSHVTIEASGLKAGHPYSVVMAPGVLVSATNKPFAGVTKPDLIKFSTAPGGDTQSPTLASIALDGTMLKAGADVGVTFTFSEKIAALPAVALGTPHATLSGLHTTDGGTTWVARLAGVTGTTANANVVSVDMSQVRDLAGNAGSGTANSGGYAVDTAAPAVASISLNGTTLGSGNQIAATITFTEAVSGLTAAAISAPNATLGLPTSSDGGITWVVTLSAADSNTSRDNVLSVDASVVRDLAGNAGSGTSSAPVSYTVDIQTPAVSVIEFDGTPTLKQGGSLDVIIRFTEEISTLDPVAISTPHATLSNLHRVDALTWGATLRPEAGAISAEGNVSIDMTKVRDLSGNPGNGSASSASYLVDTSAPAAVSIKLDGNTIDTVHSVGVTITFSEKVLTLDPAAIHAPHATLEHLASADGGATWTGTLTATTSTVSTGDVLSIDMSKLRDIAGNTGSGTFSSTDHYNVSPPPATIAFDQNQTTLRAGENIVVNITFTERVGDIGPDAFTTPHATLRELHPVGEDGTAWRATLTVADSGIEDATNVLSLDMSKVHYTSGHASIGNATSGNYAVDTIVSAYLASHLVIDDAGRDATDYLTNDAQLHMEGVFVGRPEAGQYVELMVDEVMIAPASIRILPNAATPGDFVWSYAGSRAFGDGVHHITARLVDADGHRSAVVSQDLTIDTNAPSIVSSPDGNQEFGVAAPIVITFDQQMCLGHGGGALPLVELVNITDVGNLVRTSVLIDQSNLSEDRKTLTISPGTPLASGSAFRIELPSILTDDAGNAPRVYQMAFRTAGGLLDIVAPRALLAQAFGASDGLHGVGETIEIRLRFDEPVRASNGAPTLLLNTGGVATYAGMNDNGRELLFKYKIAEGNSDVSRLAITDTSGLVGHVADLSGNLLDAAHIDFSSMENFIGGYGGNIQIDGHTPDLLAAPVLDLAVPNPGNLTNSSLLSFHGMGAEAGAAIYLYEGDHSVGFGHAGAGGGWTVTIDGALGDGAHTFTARQADAAGNESAASGPVTVMIDTIAAALAAPLLAAESDTGLLPSDRITFDTTPTFTGSGAEANSIVRLYAGEVKVGETQASATGDWSITSIARPEGLHSFTVTQVDRAGNVSLASAAVALTIDTTAPAALLAPVLSSDTGISAIDGITNAIAPTFTGSGAEANSLVRLYDGTALVGEAESSAAGVWSITSTVRAEGLHSFTATQVDRAGNVSLASAAVALTIDTSAPVLAAPALDVASDTGTSNIDRLTKIAAPMVSGTGAEAHAIVKLYDGETVVGEAEANSSGGWSITASALADGLHALTVKQVDLAGNKSAASAPVELTIDTTAPAAPLLAAVGDTGISAVDGITSAITPTFTGSGAEANSTVKLYDGTALVGEVQSSAAGAWSITSIARADGLHSFTATQVDRAGNVSLASAPVALTIDTSAPAALAAPVLDVASDTGISNIDRITNSATPMLSGAGAEAHASVKLYDGATVVGQAEANANGGWTITASALANGVHSLTVKQMDIAGNESAASTATSVTIDTIAPIVTGSNRGPMKGDLNVVFSEAIILTADASLSVHNLVTGLLPFLASDWSVANNDAGTAAVLRYHTALAGDYRMLIGAQSVHDVAGNAAVIGSPSFDFHVPLLGF